MADAAGPVARVGEPYRRAARLDVAAGGVTVGVDKLLKKAYGDALTIDTTADARRMGAQP